MPQSTGRHTKRALGRIQRLCCLGIGSELLMPDLVREVVGMIPSNRGWFRWAGPNLEITNLYIQSPPTGLELYLKEFHNRSEERSIHGTFGDSLCLPVPRAVLDYTKDLLRVDPGTLHRTDYYNIIM